LKHLGVKPLLCFARNVSFVLRQAFRNRLNQFGYDSFMVLLFVGTRCRHRPINLGLRQAHVPSDQLKNRDLARGGRSLRAVEPFNGAEMPRRWEGTVNKADFQALLVSPLSICAFCDQPIAFRLSGPVNA
jgi:hypothetical protein